MKVRNLFALTCVLSLGACKPVAPKTAPPMPPVSVTSVVQQDVPIVRNWIGTLEGFSNAEVKARVVGYVMERNYVEGAAVKKDDQLFLIDPRPFQTALAQAKAQLSQAQAVQERSKLELDKTQTLFKQGVVSQRDIDNNTQTNLANVANVQAATAAVGQAELNLF
ncbi:MAG: biotin/lipoyl-binding protein, partial [Verrucomicrobia bacterium]|nr:biotin/lipoyl-binding protein [Verrucomicrobiota bacterium]